MAEELNVNTNTPNGADDNETVDLSPEDLELLGDKNPKDLTVEDFLTEKRARLDLEEKNKHLYARAKNNSPLKNNPVESHPEKIEEIDLRSRGYNDEEISVLQKYGGVGALKDPIIMAGISEMRAKRAAEQATVDVGTGGGSDVERQYTHQQLKDMPLADLEKILPKA